MENTADETESEASVTIERSSSDTSASDARIFFKAFGKNRNNDTRHMIPLVVPKLVLNLSSPGCSPAGSPASSPKLKTRPPPLVLSDSTFLDAPKPVPIISVQNENGEMLERFDSAPRQRSQSIDVGSVMKLPSITISMPGDSPSSPKKTKPEHAFEPPVFTITCASPKPERRLSNTRRNSEGISPFHSPIINVAHVPSLIFKKKCLLGTQDKPGSLDLSNASTTLNPLLGIDSDPESPNPLSLGPGPKLLSPYLSAAGLHMVSESNLSSSGYSSAYSPGPSRCNSNNPLFSNETDDPPTPSVSSIPIGPLSLPNKNPFGKLLPSVPTISHPLSSSCDSTKTAVTLPSMKVEPVLIRTDSETTDEPQTSQPDSALDVDTNDEPESEGASESHSVKENTNLSTETGAQRQRILFSSSHSFPKETPKLQRCPPTIVVHASLQRESSLEELFADKPLKLSPVSSRSESPISDSKLSVHKIYPSFFGTPGKLELPYTDSDGLYDCPSSEVLNSDCHKSQTNLRRPGRRKVRRSNPKNKGAYYIGGNLVDQGGSGPSFGTTSRSFGPALEAPQLRSSKRTSPKRRPRLQNSLDLMSSSNESVTSVR